MEPREYSTMSGGINFANPLNPGFYPATLAMNAEAGNRAKAKAEHKELINQYETFEGVRLLTKDLILEAVENECLIKIEHETLGFLNKTPRQVLKHLLDRGGALDFADTNKNNLLAKRDGEWNVNENPQIYFNRLEKAMKSLAQNGINSDLNKQRDMALYHLKAAGEFDAAVREWEQKPTASKTSSNIKNFISMEYGKENKQNKLTAKQFSANAIHEQAEATEELIATLTEAHTQQMKNLVRSTTEAMKEMMQLLKENKTPTSMLRMRRKTKRDKKNKRNTTITRTITT